MRKVQFLFFGKSGRHLLDERAEIWTLNDWYQHPFAASIKHPSRVYNIHESFTKHDTDASRFSGDWKRAYNESGAKVVTFDLIEGLDNQRVFDVARGVADFGKSWFGGSFSYMFADAIFEKVDEIDIIGLDLLGDEYRWQSGYVAENLRTVRAAGIVVNLANEERLELGRVDWAGIEDSVSLMYGERGFTARGIARSI